ncbi:hypothetical protein M758_UG017100 [Ceratodon purpureus]|nr:hypothetical protein M758_UG017100 [Ceratodon purpureus]
MRNQQPAYQHANKQHPKRQLQVPQLEQQSFEPSPPPETFQPPLLSLSTHQAKQELSVYTQIQNNHTREKQGLSSPCDCPKKTNGDPPSQRLPKPLKQPQLLTRTHQIMHRAPLQASTWQPNALAGDEKLQPVYVRIGTSYSSRGTEASWTAKTRQLREVERYYQQPWKYGRRKRGVINSTKQHQAHE